tara:strand:- start:4920 stop:5246 length:327 start_codon:yes stop_codon:yes gene_type:complete
MLDLKEFKELAHDNIFGSGVFVDSHLSGFLDGLPTIHAQNTGGERMSWVAVKGMIHDWAIYYYYEKNELLNTLTPLTYVRNHGVKLHDYENIKKLVPCSDDVLECYRL